MGSNKQKINGEKIVQGASGVTCSRLKTEQYGRKLDGVGLVDNRPSTNKLHQFVRRKKNKIKN